jgi:hypothetical protein
VSRSEKRPKVLFLARNLPKEKKIRKKHSKNIHFDCRSQIFPGITMAPIRPRKIRTRNPRIRSSNIANSSRFISRAGGFNALYPSPPIDGKERIDEKTHAQYFLKERKGGIQFMDFRLFPSVRA